MPENPITLSCPIGLDECLPGTFSGIAGGFGIHRRGEVYTRESWLPHDNESVAVLSGHDRSKGIIGIATVHVRETDVEIVGRLFIEPDNAGQLNEEARRVYAAIQRNGGADLSTGVTPSVVTRRDSGARPHAMTVHAFVLHEVSILVDETPNYPNASLVTLRNSSKGTNNVRTNHPSLLGYELTNGIVYHRDGTPVCTEEVFVTRNTIFESTYREAFASFMAFRLKRPYMTDAAALTEWKFAVTAHLHNALQAGVDTGGGYLLPPDQVADFMRSLAAASPILDGAFTRPTDRDYAIHPRLVPTSDGSADEILDYGLATIKGSGRRLDFTNSLKLGSYNVAVDTIRIGLLIGRDFAADAGVNLQAFDPIMAEAAALDMAGDAIKIMLESADIPDVTVGSGGAVTNANDGLIDLVSRLPSAYQSGAVLLGRATTIGAVRKLRAGASGPYLFPARGDELVGLGRFSYSPHLPAQGRALLYVNPRRAFAVFPRSVSVTMPSEFEMSDGSSPAERDQVALIYKIRIGIVATDPRGAAFGTVGTSS